MTYFLFRWESNSSRKLFPISQSSTGSEIQDMKTIEVSQMIYVVKWNSFISFNLPHAFSEPNGVPVCAFPSNLGFSPLTHR